MKIRTKLIVAFAVIIALFVVSSVITVYFNAQTSNEQNEIKQNINLNQEVVNYQQGVAWKVYGLLLICQGEYATGEQITNNANEGMIVPAQDSILTCLANDSEGLAMFNSASVIISGPLDTTSQQILTIVNGNDTDKLTELNTQFMELNNEYEAFNMAAINITSATQEHMQNAITTSQNNVSLGNIVGLAFFVAAAAASAALAFVIGKKITSPLRKLTNVADKVSNGEVDQTVDVKTNDEINDLAESFQRMINAFKMTVAMGNQNEEES